MNPQVDWATVQVKGSFQNRLLRWICERACATDPNNIITLAAYTPNPKAFTTSCTVYHEFTSRPLVVLLSGFAASYFVNGVESEKIESYTTGPGSLKAKAKRPASFFSSIASLAVDLNLQHRIMCARGFKQIQTEQPEASLDLQPLFKPP